MNGKSCIVLLSALTLLLVVIAGGCNTSKCSSGMCSLNGENLTESQVREKASVFAYKKLLARQEDPKTAIDDNENKPYPVEKIDPASWEVTRTDTGWKLKRYFAGHFWHVVECNFDGFNPMHYYDIGPVLEQ